VEEEAPICSDDDSDDSEWDEDWVDSDNEFAEVRENCPWYLFAAPDSRTKAWVVKKYVREHKCERDWVLKQFTAKYLAANYLEKCESTYYYSHFISIN
jgi:hypothetical protein